MLGSSTVVAFVGVADLGRARGFYGETLGLALRDESPYALVGEGAGTMLRITAVAHPAAAPYTVVGWLVPDIGSTVDALVARGVRFSRYRDRPGQPGRVDGTRRRQGRVVRRP